MPEATSSGAGAAGRPWTSRSFGSGLQHGIFYALIRVGGRRAAYALLYVVVAYYTLCRPAIRGRTRHYLARRFPGRSGPGRLLDAYRLSLALGKALVDRAVVGILGPGAMRAELRGREALLELLAEGRGLVLVTAHVGCWQAAMSALTFLEAPVSMLMQREEGDVDRHYFEHGGGPSPYRIIDPRGYLGGALEMMEVLKRGEVLCVMGDRVQGGPRSAVPVDFLGRPAPFPIAGYKLAAATGAPVAVLFSAKTGPRRYELELAEVIRVPERTGRPAAAFGPFAARFVAALEAYTEAHPYQFFNFYDLWEGGEPASPERREATP